MNTPEAPDSDELHSRHKFYGGVVAALSCDTDRLTRLNQIVDQVIAENATNFAAMKADINGGLREVRGETKKLSGDLHKRISDLHHEMRDKEAKFEGRASHLVTREDHQRVGQRFGKLDERLKERSEKIDARLEERTEKLDSRLKPLERINILVVSAAALILLVAGSVWNIVNEEVDKIEALEDQAKSFSNQMDLMHRSLNELRAIADKQYSAPNSNGNGEYPL
jgi:hypothetical protein